jgi:hypothetical protein
MTPFWSSPEEKQAWLKLSKRGFHGPAQAPWPAMGRSSLRRVSGLCCSLRLWPLLTREEEKEERDNKEENKEKIWKIFQTWKNFREKIKDNLRDWSKKYFCKRNK